MNHRKLIARAAWLVSAQMVALHAHAAPENVSLTGVVTDRDGHALEHAEVSVQDAGGSAIAQVRTGRDGKFEVEHLAPGTYALTIDAKGFSSNTRIETIEAGKPREIDVALEKGSALDVNVDAQRLDRARNGFQPDIGASVY
ncbi:MAG TPA: carboxypeptidase-like regulatory domain-containing protein, partial [Trinickia sp.]|nr:carboxypeptidase-like regulatory domain-containing protein [Trinickia sp.]